MRTDSLISVVAPTQNDAGILQDFVADVTGVLRSNYSNFEIILIDDYSTDGTVSVAEKLMTRYPSMRLIRLSRRFGTDVAVTAGLEASIGDYVVVIRPQSDPPSEIPSMVRTAENEAGAVLGTAAREEARGPLVGILRKVFFWLLRRALHFAPPDDATGFCVLSRPVVNAITRIKSKYRHLGFLSCAVGYSVTRYPYRQIARTTERRVRPLHEAVNEAISVFVTNSFFPLRIVSYVGVFAGFLNLLYVGYIVLVNLLKRQVAEGWTTLSLQMSFMFFFIFLNLVIISEYVAHIMLESQDRPLYHVLDESSSVVGVNDPERRNVA